MCRRFILGSSHTDIEQRFGTRTFPASDLPAPLVVAEGDYSLIITSENPGCYTLSRFGMTPAWARQPMQLINARAEGDKNPENDPAFRGSRAIFMKPAFKKPLFNRRCLVIADAYLERLGNPAALPLLVHLKNKRHPIAFAGLYDVWTDPLTREEVHSFAIITTTANSLIRGIPAFRMPVILPFGKETRWLKPDLSLAVILEMLNPYAAAEMNAYPVSRETEGKGPFSLSVLKPSGPFLSVEKDAPALKTSSYYGHKKKP